MIRHSRPFAEPFEARQVTKAILSGNHATKKEIRRFENKFSSFIGVKGALAVNAGTSALHLGLLSMGIKTRDEVIIPSFVCTALLNAVMYTGAKPVLADVEEGTFNISVKSAARKINKRTKAVIVPHMFGLPVDIRPFLELGAPVIEDCAQSLGAEFREKKTGSYGHISVFSFYATKLISTGHGGMLASDSIKVLKRAGDLLNFDKRNNYKLRYNYNMSDFQAVLGMSQLARLGGFIAERKRIARRYDLALSGTSARIPLHQDNIYYRYVLRTRMGAGRLIAQLRKRGIEAKKPVFKPLHRYLGQRPKDFKIAEKLFKESVSLPLYPGLKEHEKKKIINILKQIKGI